MRQLARQTGADVKSWNEDTAAEGSVRTFLLQVRHSLNIYAAESRS